jgi:hypothetical protein
MVTTATAVLPATVLSASAVLPAAVVASAAAMLAAAAHVLAAAALPAVLAAAAAAMLAAAARLLAAAALLRPAALLIPHRPQCGLGPGAPASCVVNRLAGSAMRPSPSPSVRETSGALVVGAMEPACESGGSSAPASEEQRQRGRYRGGGELFSSLSQSSLAQTKAR